jgi:hypothetical protein
MSPRGGKREPGPGKSVGRPRVHAPGERIHNTVTVSFSITPEEREQLHELLADLDLKQSEFLSRVLANAWFFHLAPAQLDALRTLAAK